METHEPFEIHFEKLQRQRDQQQRDSSSHHDETEIDDSAMEKLLENFKAKLRHEIEQHELDEPYVSKKRMGSTTSILPWQYDKKIDIKLTPEYSADCEPHIEGDGLNFKVPISMLRPECNNGVDQFTDNLLKSIRQNIYGESG